MRCPLLLSLLTVLPGCCDEESTADTASTPDTAVDTGASTVPSVEADCDGQDDDLNGVVDDGAAPGWLTDPTRWEQVAAISAGVNGTTALDLLEAPGGDGVYVTATEWSADNWIDALVVYHLAEDGTLTELGRRTITPGDGYALHAAADPQGRIWIAAEYTITSFGAASEPLVVRFDPLDGTWTTIIDNDPGSATIELGNVVPDAEGAWFAYNSRSGEVNEWVTVRIEADDSWSVVDSFSLAEGSSAFAGPWLSAIDPDGVLWGVGTAEDDAGVYHGIVRAGLGDNTIMLDTTIRPGTGSEEGYTDIAFDGVGRWWATHSGFDFTTLSRIDWRVVQGDRSLPGTSALWDEVAGGAAWTVAVHPSGTVFAGGMVTVASETRGLIRAGTETGGFISVFQGAPDFGRRGLVWDVFVDDDGVVWAAEDDAPGSYYGPRELRVLRLSCR
jgi:hypothetical protein